MGTEILTVQEDSVSPENSEQMAWTNIIDSSTDGLYLKDFSSSEVKSASATLGTEAFSPFEQPVDTCASRVVSTAGSMGSQ